jgi:hypothetical protein
MKTFSHWAVLFLTSCFCFGQTVSIGVKGGIRATDDITGDSATESKRYIVGPMIDVGLPLGFAVEFDALYHRHGYRTSNSNFAGSYFSRERANSWEFPILLKYRLPLPIVKPYVGAGYAPRIINGSVDTLGININLLNGEQTFYRAHFDTKLGTSGGVLAAAGVQLGLGSLRLSPEFRYTHWTDATINAFGSQGFHYQSNQDQVDLLVGITWKAH